MNHKDRSQFNLFSIADEKNHKKESKKDQKPSNNEIPKTRLNKVDRFDKDNQTYCQKSNCCQEKHSIGHQFWRNHHQNQIHKTKQEPKKQRKQNDVIAIDQPVLLFQLRTIPNLFSQLFILRKAKSTQSINSCFGIIPSSSNSRTGCLCFSISVITGKDFSLIGTGFHTAFARIKIVRIRKIHKFVVRSIVNTSFPGIIHREVHLIVVF